MKRFTLLCSLILYSSFIYAQVPNWVWTKSTGSTGNDRSLGCAVDSNGYIYITGYFTSPSITFGNTTLINAGGTGFPDDFFIAKYDASGHVLWAKSAGGTGIDEGLGITIDHNGNIYVTGYFRSPSITFDTITLNNVGMADIFVVKYDTAGNVIWAKSTGGSGDDVGARIAVDIVGNSYITGYFTSTSMIVGPTTLTNIGGVFRDLFVIKFDTVGNGLWARAAGSTLNDEGLGITIDSIGNSLVTGYFSNQSIAFDTITLTSIGGSDIFAVKYDTSGNVLWAKRAGSTGDDFGIDVALDRSGNSYITGQFEGPTFIAGSATLTNTSAGNADIFVLKLDTAGTLSWATNPAGSGFDRGRAIAVDNNGDVCIAGYFGAPNITIGANTFTNMGTSDMLVAKYDAAGNVLWATSVGGAGDDVPLDLASDGNGNVYITGFFASPSLNFGQTTLVSSGSYDLFVGRMGNPCTVPAQPGAILGNTAPCAGSSQTYVVPPANNVVYYTWSLPSGWTGTSTSNTIITTVTQGAGNITVVPINSCGGGTAQNISVIVNSLPIVSIVQSGDTLHAGPGFTAYQWKLNSNIIPGATNQDFIASQNGTYSVEVVDNNNCVGQSIPISFSVRVHEITVENVVYANPVTNTLYIESSHNIGKISIYDILGRQLFEKNVTSRNSYLDISFLMSGIYYLRTQGCNKAVKFIKQ